MSAFRNGVDADAAANGADVERGAGLVGKRSFGERGESGWPARRLGWDARIREAVTAGSGDGNLIAAAAEGLGDGSVGAGAIEDDVSRDAAGERAVIVDVTHAAQVALAFFADVAENDERDGEFDYQRG